jgi:hypothetical protein
MLDGDAYAALRDDIAAHGVHVPIVKTPDGLILDGRNRAAACAELGLPCPSVVYDGDPVAYVVSLNLLRRHLNESQRALAAARLATMERGRPRIEGKVNMPIGIFTFDPVTSQISQTEAAAMMDIGVRSVARAAAVLKGVKDGMASPDLATAIERGDVSVNKAYEEVQAMRREVQDEDEGDDIPDAEAQRAFAAAVDALLSPSPSPPPEPITPHAVHYSSATPEWYTPAGIIDRVLAVLGHIDLDPCSNAHGDAANVPARFHYTKADDGLASSWAMPRWVDDDGCESAAVKVYMNPPYGTEIGPWIERLCDAYETGEITEAIALVPARVDTAWFQPLFAYALCFVRGRLKFVGADDSAPFPSVVVYLGPDAWLFRDVFGAIGRVGVLT